LKSLALRLWANADFVSPVSALDWCFGRRKNQRNGRFRIETARR
jgi:hypothetical protein